MNTYQVGMGKCSTCLSLMARIGEPVFWDTGWWVERYRAVPRWSRRHSPNHMRGREGKANARRKGHDSEPCYRCASRFAQTGHFSHEGGGRGLPVLEEHQLAGIVTDRDIRLITDSPVILREKWYDEYPFYTIKVEACMTPGPITVSPDTSMEEAAKLMRHRKVGGLPVMQADRLVGIVTETDVLNCFIELLESGAV